MAKISEQTLRDLQNLVWGTEPTLEVFQRWSQGFIFSEDEHTALVQLEGGPCPVIAPVQAFLLKNVMLSAGENWRNIPKESCYQYLVSALCDILEQCHSDQFILVLSDNNTSSDSSSGALQPTAEVENKRIISFHNSLRMTNHDTLESVRAEITKNLPSLMVQYGILNFFYSVILSKGVDQIKNEMGDQHEPLILEAHGYGSQSLINLFLTGRAVSNVWDNDIDVAGLKLSGIPKRSQIGFLSLLEHLRYLEVGCNLKSPEYPIWLVGSETHLTVIFSMDKILVAPETQQEMAQRIFKSYDPEGNNFIASSLLKDVLSDLELFAEHDYVELMKQRLDSESLGVILLPNFMEEFFPSELSPDKIIKFVFYHYNGLPTASPQGKVKYISGQAVLALTPMEAEKDPPPVLRCLRTKWNHLDVEWEGSIPSIN